MKCESEMCDEELKNKCCGNRGENICGGEVFPPVERFMAALKGRGEANQHEQREQLSLHSALQDSGLEL